MAVSRTVNESHYDLGMGYCPSYHHAAELVGRRWNGVIIRALLLGATRFGEIAEQIPEMSDKMLANRLRELEDEGVIQRTVEPTRARTRRVLTHREGAESAPRGARTRRVGGLLDARRQRLDDQQEQ